MGEAKPSQHAGFVEICVAVCQPEFKARSSQLYYFMVSPHPQLLAGATAHSFTHQAGSVSDSELDVKLYESILRYADAMDSSVALPLLPCGSEEVLSSLLVNSGCGCAPGHLGWEPACSQDEVKSLNMLFCLSWGPQGRGQEHCTYSWGVP